MSLDAVNGQRGEISGGKPIAAHNQGVHLPSVKVGFQRLKGQKRTEMAH